jgi:preprotein translocase subunit SecD
MVYLTKWKVLLALGICLLGLLFALPTFLSRQQVDAMPGWLPRAQISLGLDLQGGSHLLLEVGTQAVIKEYLESIIDGMRNELRKAQIAYEGLGAVKDAAAVTIKDPAKIEAARKLIRDIDRDARLDVSGNRISLAMTEKMLRDRKVAAVQQSIEIVRRRVDETGTRDPIIQRQGDERILLQLPGINDPERVKRLLGKTAKMTFHLLDDRNTVEAAMAGRVPPGSQLLQSDERDQRGQQQMYLVRKRVMVSGDTLIDSQPSFDSRTSEPIVNFRFNSAGAKRFGDVTSHNVGKPFAIVLDGKVISAPVIREPILGGSGQISGRFTVQDAKDLALLLRAGALPAPLTILEERTVGPDLGSDSIRAGTIACIIGYLLIVVLMIVGYGLFGIIANVALLLNLAFTIAIMAGLDATLTLPGIAGMVLGLAMAVDANVLIYERMREESDQGRTPFSTVDVGFRRAYGTILDSNLTTLIAALILYMLGSGPVRGFAVTLSIGIACSMFTAVTVTRLMVVGYLLRFRPKTLPL